MMLELAQATDQGVRDGQKFSAADILLLARWLFYLLDQKPGK